MIRQIRKIRGAFLLLFNLQNYLKASNFKVGLLVNFGKHGALEYERIVRTDPSSNDSLDS